MFLSRLILNPRNPDVRRDLSDCQELHRTVMSAFPQSSSDGGARADLGVLYRVDTHPRTGQIALLVQSKVAPDWSGLKPGYLLDTEGDVDNPACKPVDGQYGSLEPGAVLVFRLRANPTRKIHTKSGPDGQRRNGKRVELRKEADQVQWLRRKGGGAFRLLSVRANPQVPNVRATEAKLVGLPRTASEASAGAKRITLASVLFEGELQVADADRFRQLLTDGIGPGKAYGCGLLSVARTGRGP